MSQVPTSEWGPSSAGAYQELLQLFIRLRGRGSALSAHDMEICLLWHKDGVPVSLVAQVMLDLQNECIQQQRPFPGGLSSIARRVSRAALKSTQGG